MSDRDAPNILVPKLPGTAIIAIVGGLLVVGLLVMVALNWANGTLDDRLRVESSEDANDLDRLATSPAGQAIGAVRVTVTGTADEELPIAFFESAFSWQSLGPDMWRWPSGGPEGASTVVLEDNVLLASPVREDLAQTLRAEAVAMGLTVELVPLKD
ncbi:MAG: hypothetical protein AB8H79_11555 [Myxococcota bacterium]